MTTNKESYCRGANESDHFQKERVVESIKCCRAVTRKERQLPTGDTEVTEDHGESKFSGMGKMKPELTDPLMKITFGSRGENKGEGVSGARKGGGDGVVFHFKDRID